MVRAAQKGELENPSPEVADVADDISVKDAKKFCQNKTQRFTREEDAKRIISGLEKESF